MSRGRVRRSPWQRRAADIFKNSKEPHRALCLTTNAQCLNGKPAKLPGLAL